MNRKKQAFRGVRKSAYISRKLFSKAANFSGKVENKADRILHGRDSTIQIHDRMPYEKIYSEAIPEITPIYPSLPLAGRQPNVTLLIPSLQKSSFFGGTATALIIAGFMARKCDRPLRIIETLKHGNADVSELQNFFEESDIDWNNDRLSLVNLSDRSFINYGYLEMHPDDIFIASAWWDAHLLNKLPLMKRFIYLIQDFEPIFYNNSDRYALAEETYHSEKFVALCNTQLMYDFMINRGYKNVSGGAWFEPAVSRTKNAGKKKAGKSKKKMFLYGRPNVERNLFFTALSALNYCFEEKYLSSDHWEICMGGQDKLPDIQMSTGATIKNLGKMNMNQYIDLIKEVDVAVSPMMAPHPNYPTLEFASAGAQVVTTKYDIKQDLSKYSKNIIMADISKESMAGAINLAAERAEKGLNYKSSVSSSWTNSLDKPVDAVMTKLKTK